MNYMTVREASEKWNITVRSVQDRCEKGRIPGATRFSRAWAIPIDAEKPKDRRSNKSDDNENALEKACQSMCGDEKLLSKIVEFFPYPIQVAALDGTMIMANEAFFKFFYIAYKDRVIGEYNLFDDPIIEELGIKEKAARAYQGETVYLNDIPLPIQSLVDKYGKGEVILETIFLNITSFPIYNDAHQLAYVGTILTTSKLYRGKDEIVKGQVYIEEHWQENFDLEKTASASGLSKTQFQRLFKSYTGFTPHDYYITMKIKMLKEKLLDLNLTISQVFTECGLDYNGHYARLFKKKTGITPSEYRKNNV